MTVLLNALVVVLVITGAYFVARMVWVIGGSAVVVLRESRRVADAVSSELAALTTDQIRERLLADSYFDDAIRADSAVASFLRRVANQEEVALRREFTKRRLYSMLARAEHAAGRRGRPEAVDTIDLLDRQLDELARRANAAGRAV